MDLSSLLWWLGGAAAVLAVFIVGFGIVYRRIAGVSSSKASMKGKTVIITGASAGIGMEAARDIARRGARVILACRNLTKAAGVAADIQTSTGNSDVVVRELDTSSLASVRAFAANILATESRLDVLVLNAGIGGLDERRLTSEGLEMTMATNHFGHFLLGNLLLGLLKKCSPSRIVITSSDSHGHISGFDPKNLNFEKGEFGPYRSYCQSKLCNVLYARHLSHLLADTGVVANSHCPGLVATEIFQKSGGFLVGKLFRFLALFMSKTVEQGAQTIIHLATAPETATISGKFFMDCKVSEVESSYGRDNTLAKIVWEESEQIVGLKPEEKHY